MSRKLLIVDVTGSFAPVGPPPPKELGRSIERLADAEKWLMHPSNWVDSRFDSVYWDLQHVPRLSADVARRLLQNPQDKEGLFSVIIRDQYERKHPKVDDKKEEKKNE